MVFTQTHDDPDIWYVQAFKRNGCLKFEKPKPLEPKKLCYHAYYENITFKKSWVKLTFGARVADLYKIGALLLDEHISIC